MIFLVWVQEIGNSVSPHFEANNNEEIRREIDLRALQIVRRLGANAQRVDGSAEKPARIRDFDRRALIRHKMRHLFDEQKDVAQRSRSAQHHSWFQ